MNQPLPGPRPVPGPRHPDPSTEPAYSVDPDEVRRNVADLLEQADEVAAAIGESADGAALAQLARQAELLSQAHAVLTDALEKVDRV